MNPNRSPFTPRQCAAARQYVHDELQHSDQDLEMDRQFQRESNERQRQSLQAMTASAIECIITGKPLEYRRTEKVQQARRRIQSGFYDSEEVVGEVVEKILISEEGKR